MPSTDILSRLQRAHEQHSGVSQRSSVSVAVPNGVPNGVSNGTPNGIPNAISHAVPVPTMMQGGFHPLGPPMMPPFMVCTAQTHHQPPDRNVYPGADPRVAGHDIMVALGVQNRMGQPYPPPQMLPMNSDTQLLKQVEIEQLWALLESEPYVGQRLDPMEFRVRFFRQLQVGLENIDTGNRILHLSTNCMVPMQIANCFVVALVFFFQEI